MRGTARLHFDASFARYLLSNTLFSGKRFEVIDLEVQLSMLLVQDECKAPPRNLCLVHNLKTHPWLKTYAQSILKSSTK